MRCPVWLTGAGTVPGPPGSPLDAFPQLQAISFHAREDRALLSAPGGAPVVLRTWPPSPYSPVLYPANFSYLSLPRLSALSPPSHHPPSSSWVLPPCFSQDSKLGESQVSPHSFSISQVSLSYTAR